MPIHLTSLPTRRQFLRETLGTLTVLSAGSLSADTGSSDWVLAGDTHIDANPSTTVRGVNMSENFRSAAAQILAQAAASEALFINGDCAYLQGLPGDYRQLRTLLEPLRQAELDVHLTLGNHDHRDNFRQAFGTALLDPGPVPGKHLTVIRTPLVNWFLLDSLLEVNKVTGNLGEAQLQWLDAVLDQFAAQPAILLGHHNPQFAPGKAKDGTPYFSGLSDTAPFLELLHRKPHVQAYVFAHTHNWKVTQTERGLHLVNLPPVAYVFDASRPSGWVKARVDRQALQLELASLNPTHPEHGQKVSLAWR